MQYAAMEDYETKMAEHELVSRFPRNAVGTALAAEALALWRASSDDGERAAAERLAAGAAGYAEYVYRQNAFTRLGDMAEWFGLPTMSVHALSARRDTLMAAWAAAARNDDDEQLARDEREQERVDDLENGGFYGRTLAYAPECDEWLFIRFGPMPSSGRSVFGLAREDNEDGPDPWRTELGGITHEAGVCVFRAYRHPDVPDAYVLISPDFSMARYGVQGADSHMLSVIPLAAPEEIAAFRIDGCLATVRARDGTLRADLGSDGEYMIDAGKPFSSLELPLSRIWISEKTRADAFLTERRRGWSADDDGGNPAP